MSHLDTRPHAFEDLAAIIACNAVLIATAFGLYYLGSEELSPWASNIHIAFGLAIPLLFLAHIKTGRKRI